MSTAEPVRAPLFRRRMTWVVIIGVAALAVIALGIHLAGGNEGFSIADADLGSWTYLAVALLVFGDAICALFPGETTLNAAATLAANGELDLGLVMLAGAVGAIVGDSTLYWIARRASGRVSPYLDKAEANPKVASALGILGKRASVLLVVGRYVPGVRFVVNATLGLRHHPYRSFLLWSSVGGIIWSVYTCALAYAVATALSGFPLASVIISGVISTVAIAAVILVMRRSAKAARAAAAAATDAPDD